MAPSKTLVDFSKKWDGTSSASLANVPKNRKGVCGCDLSCGGDKSRVVKGSVYIDHQALILQQKRLNPSSPKKQRLNSPLPQIHPLPSVQVPTYSPAADIPMAEGNFDTSPDPEATAGEMVEGGMQTGGNEDEGYTPTELGQDSGDDGQGVDGQGVRSASAILQGLSITGLGRDADDISELGDVEHLQGDEDDSCDPIDIEALLRAIGPTKLDIIPLSHDDLILQWPHPLTASSFLHDHSGCRANPYADLTPTAPSTATFLEILPILLAFTLSSAWNICRQAVELTLRVAAMIQIARELEYDKFKQWYLNNHANIQPDILVSLGKLDPKLNPSVPPVTLSTSLGRLGIDQTVIVHPVCGHYDCSHLHEDIRTISDFSKLPVNCPGCTRRVRDEHGKPNVLPFPVRELWRELEHSYSVPGVEDALSKREAARSGRRERDLSRTGDEDYHHGRILYEQDDGSAWDEREVGNELHTHVGTPVIPLIFSLDWANTSSRRGAAQNSFGPMTVELAGLANRDRRIATTMLMGMTPGPRKPSGRVLHKLLVPFFKQVRDAETNGVWIKTPAFPKGRLFLVKLLCIVADRPAAVDITGGPYYGNYDTACLRCTATHDEALAMTPCPHRDSSAHHRRMVSQPQEVAEAIADAERVHREGIEAENATRPRSRRLQVTRLPQKRRIEIADEISTARGNISATMLLHRFQQIISTPFDSMHSLLEGLVKTSFYPIGLCGKHTDDPSLESNKLINPGSLRLFQTAFLTLILPIHVSKLHPTFGSPSAIQPSADQWRSLATVYGPLLLPVILAARLKRHPHLQRQFHLMMRLFEIVTLALRSSISEEQIDHLEGLIDPYLRDMYDLFPGLVHTTNFHILIHLCEDIRRYGPVYGWWSFRLERVNYILKHIKVSGASIWQDVVVRMRAYMRKREVEDAPVKCLGEMQGDGGWMDKVRDAFRKVKQGLAIGDTFNRTEDQPNEPGTWSSSVPFESKGSISDRPLSTAHYRLLQASMNEQSIPFSTAHSTGERADHPYLPYASRHHSHIIINGVRVESIDPECQLPLNLSAAEAIDAVRTRNTLIELRSHAERYGTTFSSTQAFVVCSMFQHRHISEEAGLYMILRPLVQAKDRDIWGFGDVPGLCVGVWDAQALGEPVIIRVSMKLGADIGLLAAATAELDTDSPLWLTLPLSRHLHL